jgi:hypothetical protein
MMECLEMTIFSVFVIFLLFFLMAGLLVFYFQTQQSLRDLTEQVGKLQPQAAMRSPNAIRLERAAHQDRLVLMEADLNQTPRDILTEAELKQVDQARDAIKLCNDELKHTGEWIGLPFDFEWTEMFNRMPTLKTRYAASVESLAAVDNPSLSGDPRSTVTRQK